MTMQPAGLQDQATGDERLLFTSGPRLGWVFRDRRVRSRRKQAAAGAGAASGTGVGRTSGTVTGGTGAGVLPVAGAASRGTPARQQRTTGTYSGPRADLHKQLDDLGL